MGFFVFCAKSLTASVALEIRDVLFLLFMPKSSIAKEAVLSPMIALPSVPIKATLPAVTIAIFFVKSGFASVHSFICSVTFPIIVAIFFATGANCFPMTIFRLLIFCSRSSNSRP